MHSLFKYIFIAILTIFPLISTADILKTPESFPPFEFPAIVGKSQSTTSTSGTVVVLNFWFTTCPPCVTEVASLNALVEKFKGKNVAFVAPTWDSKPKVSTFLKKHPFSYDIVGFGESNPEAFFENGKMRFPMHIVLNKNGQVIYRAYSEANISELSAAIETAL